MAWMRRIGVLVASAVLVVAACGSGDDGDQASTTTTTTAATTSTSAAATTSSSPTTAPTTTAAPCPAPPPAPTGPFVSPVVGGAQYLTDVAVSSDECVDRVTFDFTSRSADPPSYRIEYRPGPFTEDASGEPVTVEGQAFLVVRLEPAYGYDFENGVPTYTGSKRIDANGTHRVTEVVQTGDFEAVITWVIGLDTTRPVAVEATADPQHRLVVTVF
jgi:hypothetical protein